MNINTNGKVYNAPGSVIPGNIPEQMRANANIEAETIKAAVESVLSQAEMQDDMLEQILSGAGFKVNEENKQLVNMLMSDGKAVTKENLTKLNRFVKLMGNENADKALFFMNSDIKPTFANGEKLAEIADHIFRMSEETVKLADTAGSSFDDAPFRDAVLNKLSGNIPEGSILKGNNFEKAADKLNEFIDAGMKELAENAADEADAGINMQKEGVKPNAEPPAREAMQTLPKEQSLPKALSEQTKLESFVAENKEKLFDALKEGISKGSMDVFKKELSDMAKNNFKPEKIIDELFKNAPELKETAEKVLNASNEFKKAVKEKLNFDVKGKSGEELEKFVRELKENITDIKKAMEEANPQKYAETVKSADNALSKADFMNELRDTAMIQIPVTINNKEETAEIYVFNNRKGNGKRSGGGVSAVISLDTGYIGHFEAYAIKNDKSVDIQFRVEERTQNIIGENIEILGNYLKDKGLSLRSYSFRNTDEKFSLIQKEPELSDTNEKTFTNFAFDKTT